MSIINEALKKATIKGEGIKVSLPGSPVTKLKENILQNRIIQGERPSLVTSRSRYSGIRRIFFFLGLFCCLALLGFSLGYYLKVHPLQVKGPVTQKKDPPSSEIKLQPISSDLKSVLPLSIAQTEIKQESMEPAKKSFLSPKERSRDTEFFVSLDSEKKHSSTSHLKQKFPKIELTGIMMETPPQALVNGQFVGEGDRVAEGVTVLKIEADHVTLSRNGHPFKKWIN
ncbi:MAG: general secretion pathway protein GspB [Chlamydiae bacterium]|nr:general secretion pathway protein GspB [Chlamydiota bacterium]MBI3276550.1 general secretion pathway protein GspB [Chlamydiota bacterium]